MILTADARHLPLADESVHCCVTSPPYWGLRSYSTSPRVWGGAPHVHVWGEKLPPKPGRGNKPGDFSTSSLTNPDRQDVAPRADNSGAFCACGAWRGELGLEPTPDLYIAHLVAVFAEVWRVLRDDGTCWVNLGDTYNNFRGSTNGQTIHDGELRDKFPGRRKVDHNLKEKDLVGIPWAFAFAARSAGWYLRSEIIWAKNNPMPESVRDRPTTSHEKIFLLTKSARYYYDAQAIAEPVSDAMLLEVEQGYDGLGLKDYAAAGVQNPSSVKARIIDGYRKRNAALARGGDVDHGYGPGRGDGGAPCNNSAQTTRNKRSVWTVATQPFSGAHFATMPEAIVEPCILAGCPMAGKRCDCDEIISTPLGTGESDDPSRETGRAGFNRPRRLDEGTRPITRREQRDYAEQMKSSPHREEMATAAGEAFAHYIRTDSSGARPLPPDLLREWRARDWLREPEPCRHPIEPAGIVLDPFLGSGTVGAVAERLGRRWVGTDLSYQSLAVKRTAQRGLMFAEAVD